MTATRNILALDVGERRIGVALTSLEARLPAPLTTIDRTKFDNIYQAISDLIQKYEASIIVVGLPRDMNGQETAQTKATHHFVTELQAATALPIYLQDEAGTSLLAKEELQQRGKPYQKGDVDKLAATYILRDWLDTQLREANA
jgi:putative Holliday junction resolvase